MLNTDRLYPWPLGVMVYQGEYSVRMAPDPRLHHARPSCPPILLFDSSPQKHIVAGLTAGAVKG
jgi:raffinose/stachyose/melibiose transport system permease protein